MQITRSGKTLLVQAPAGAETYTFATVAEARARLAFVDEALSWIGTPFVNCADVKGPKGAVDCAMLLTRCAVDTGLVPAFDPRPYPAHWYEHREEQRFINFLTDRLGAREIDVPRFADIAVWQFGHTFSHGAIILNSAEIVHAWSGHRMVTRSHRNEPMLAEMPVMGTTRLRPVRYFDLWSVR